MDIDLFGVFPDGGELKRVTFRNNTYQDRETTYLISGSALSEIRIHQHHISFDPALDITKAGTGLVDMLAGLHRGRLAGAYSIANTGIHPNYY